MHQDKKALKQREEAFAENERHAKLDGQGELDADGELALRDEADSMQAKQVAATLELEAASAEQVRTFIEPRPSVSRVRAAGWLAPC